MEVITELRKQNDQQLTLEVEEIGKLLSITNPASDEFTRLLALMKNKINQMSDE